MNSKTIIEVIAIVGIIIELIIISFNINNNERLSNPKPSITLTINSYD
jgi:hypothetical protein